MPPDPITTSEKKAVLQRLNQVIQYRLVSSELPQHMRKLKIGQCQNRPLQTIKFGKALRQHMVLGLSRPCWGEAWF